MLVLFISLLAFRATRKVSFLFGATRLFIPARIFPLYTAQIPQQLNTVIMCETEHCPRLFLRIIGFNTSASG